MYPTHSTRAKVVLFLKIFLPIVIYQFANFSAAFVDTMMTGRYSTLHLAGVSMSNSLWSPFFTLLTGIVSALVPIVGHHLGRQAKDKVADEFYHFIYLGGFLSLILTGIVWLGALPALRHLGLETEVLGVAQAYLKWLSIGIFPLLLFSVIRSFFDALGLTQLSMYMMLLILPFNAMFNYALIYGKFGLPEMGGAGAGLGTALTYWSLLGIVMGVLHYHPKIRPYQLKGYRPFQPKLLKTAVDLGLPIGLQIFAEVAIFAVVGLFMAKFSSQVIAAHQAAMNFITLFYAFPMSISSAMAIIISYELGAKRPDHAKRYSRIGRLTAFAIACLTLSFIFVFRTKVATLYGKDPDFVALTSHLLIFGLFFQLADAYAAPLQGILRGYKDTTVPFLSGVAAYWLVALPLALYLDHWQQLGPTAYWIGLTLGIFVSGLVLNLRLRTIAARNSI